MHKRLLVVGLAAWLGLVPLAQAKDKLKEKDKGTLGVELSVSGPALLVAPAAVTLSANAVSDQASHPVTRVEFYQGTTLIGTATAAPYRLPWPQVPAGNYTVTAKAINDKGDVGYSAPVAVAVDAPPTVSLTGPLGVYTAPATIPLTATAADSDGSIAKVDFYQGAILIGTATSAPYSVAWANAPAGSYTLTAKATDDRGATTTSSPLPIRVNAPPTVAISSPVANSVAIAPAALTLTANAADADGTVAKVEFFQGETRVGTATAAPYSVAWANVPAGTYVLTARATDSDGAVTVSAPVSLRVDAPPTVAITSPAAGQTLVAPASVTLTAQAADNDGAIAQVAFYQGSTLIGTATAAPYSVAWAPVPAGSYLLTARATDNDGATTVSAALAVTVVPNQVPSVTLTSPTAGQRFTAPASVTLTAQAGDSDGSIVRVDFYQGGTLVGTAAAAPFSVPWPNVAEGNYTLTAKAIDDKGGEGVSPPVLLTVASARPQLYYLHTDHLDTPRLVTDGQGTVVWRRRPLDEPFGLTPPETDPDGNGIPFTLNLRFPGQYFDAETNTHYNYYRDYDPQIGRYRQSDPIGLAGGINTYLYVGGDPVSKFDPDGLQARGVPQSGGPGAHLRWPSLGPSASQVGGPYSTTSQGRVNEISGSRGRLSEYSGNLIEFFGNNTNGPVRILSNRDGTLRFETTLENGVRLQYREGPNGPRVDIYPPGGTAETLHPTGGYCPR